MSDRRQPRVALFVTCLVDNLYPEVGIAAADLLERNGAAVNYPAEQSCCGQPAFNAGYRADAKLMARHFVDVFWPLLNDGSVDAIVAPSGSCVAMVRNYYRLLFSSGERRYAERAAELVGAIYELSEYLVDVLGVRSVDARFPAKITYHPCCHLLRELGVDEQPRRLLSTVQDAAIVELPGADECCGFGGLFALKNAGISVAMARRKSRNLELSGADVVALCDAGCLSHLNGLLKREGHHCRAMHIATLLTAESRPRPALPESKDGR